MEYLSECSMTNLNIPSYRYLYKIEEVSKYTEKELISINHFSCDIYKIFNNSFYLVKNTNKYILTSICGITIILAIASNFMLIKEVYDKSNQEPITYLKQNIQPNDVIVFEESNFGTGSVVSLNFTDNKQFYYNPSDWGIVEAYKAFGEQLEVYTNTDFLDECTDRVWIIDSPNSDYYNKVFNNDDFEVLSRKIIETKYEGYIYNMILVQRKNITV